MHLSDQYPSGRPDPGQQGAICHVRGGKAPSPPLSSPVPAQMRSNRITVAVTSCSRTHICIQSQFRPHACAVPRWSSPHHPGDVSQATCTVKALLYVARNTDAHMHTEHSAIWDSFPPVWSSCGQSFHVLRWAAKGTSGGERYVLRQKGNYRGRRRAATPRRTPGPLWSFVATKSPPFFLDISSLGDPDLRMWRVRRTFGLACC